MAHNIVRREVQRRDDPFGIPACFYWTVDEVADWVDSIGYGKYKENFRSHFINGRKLLTVDACVLPKMGITHFGDILALKSSLEHLRSDRIPMWDQLPIYKLPRIYKFQVGTVSSGNDVSRLEYHELLPRTDRLLRSSLSYPWNYLTWQHY